jgi:hypothetical protein
LVGFILAVLCIYQFLSTYPKDIQGCCVQSGYKLPSTATFSQKKSSKKYIFLYLSKLAVLSITQQSGIEQNTDFSITNLGL